jgi:hypothetical protein
MISTIETRLKLDDKQELIVNSCLSLWSEYYRKTWVMFNNKKLTEVEIYAQLSKTNFKTNLFTSNQVLSLFNESKVKWNDVAFALGTERKLWYKQAMNQIEEPMVDKCLLDKDFNHFEEPIIA